ncbi:hypothetical protein AL060_12180 [Pseudomonas syringae pv. rhaphiolepidis]|nr:hypothetical protein AL060_12180 [Pseudomonas syringae pv. rhaphiolepidis]
MIAGYQIGWAQPAIICIGPDLFKIIHVLRTHQGCHYLIAGGRIVSPSCGDDEPDPINMKDLVF